MSSGRITRFQNNIRVDGNLDLSNSTGNLTLSSLSSAPSSPTVGDAYYDSTLGKARIYQTTGWTNVDGTAAGSLNAAYDGGATIAVDGGAVTLTDSQTTTGGGLLITKSGKVTGANSASVFHINSTGAHDTSGALKMLEISVGSETVSGGIYGIEIAMNANDDSGITITKGAMTLTDGAVTLTAGALLMTLGSFTMTAGDMTMTLGDFDTADGSVTIIDADEANSLAVTNDSITTADMVDFNSTSITTGALLKLNANCATHSGEVLEVISASGAAIASTGISVTIASTTTGAATGIAVTMVGATTAAKGIAVTMDALTTGDMLYLDNGDGSITGDGKFINCNDDNTSCFSVAVGGLTTIAGNASGTDALVLTAGDILVTSGHIDMTLGDLTLADGSVTITDADSAATLTVINNTITTSTSMVAISSSSLSTGALMTLTASSVNHDGEILELINAGDAASTGTGMSITMPDVETGAAKGISVVMVKGTTTLKGISVTTAVMTTGDMLYLDQGSSDTLTAGSGFYINCNRNNTSDFTVSKYGATTIAGTAAGTAALTLSLGDLVITDTDTTTITSVNGTGSVVEIISGGAMGADKACLEIDAAGEFNADGSLLRLSAEGVTATNSPFALDIDAASLDMGALRFVGAAATRSPFLATNAGALGADQAILEIISNAASCNADSSVVRLEQTATDGVAHCVTVKQDDIDKSFINFEGATAANYTSPISTEQGDGTVEGPKKFSASAGWLWIGMVRCAINGTKAYVPYYEEDPS